MKQNRATSRMRLEEMTQKLREDILTGTYTEGSFLPTENELCEHFHISKNTVRKGLESLLIEGLIVKIPRIGAKVVVNNTQEKTVVRFGCYETQIRESDILTIIENFNQSNPNIEVQPIPVSYPKDKAQMELFLNSHAFDVMNLNLFDYETLKETGLDQIYLAPLEPNAEVYPFLHSPFIHNGEQYVMPFVFTPVILCYNKTHFQELGIPEPDSGWSWSDMRAVSSKLSEGLPGFGFYVHLPSHNRWPVMLLQNGVVFNRNEQGNYELDDVKLRQALQCYMEIAHEQLAFPNHLSENDGHAETLFLNQKVSMIMATYSSLNDFKDAEFEYDIAPLPHLDELRTLLSIIGVAINNHSNSKNAARTFVQYLLSQEAQMHVRKQTLSIPSVKSAAEWTGEEVIKRPYRFHMYREIIHTFRLYSDLNLSTEQLNTMGDELRYYWSKMSSLDDVLKRLEQTL